MKILSLLLLLLTANYGYSLSPPIKLIPYPQDLKITGSPFAVNSGFKIKADKQLADVVPHLKTLISDWNNLSGGKADKKNKTLTISLIFDELVLNGPEAYRLSVTTDGIVIRSSSVRGCLYGIQTLKQLVLNDGKTISLPSVEINDYPNFSWRSYMLDESRHFFGKEFVLRLLDELAELKINKFHWHLTDDQGWRIEIKKYPELTKIGAFRKGTQKRGTNKEISEVPHGGFYTQEEIREVIQYAGARNIEVVPEIEMAGHSSGAIASYPWLGILGKLTEVPARFGKLEDSYNVADPRVIQFLHDVLDEVCELFPSEIVHIGGDEVLFAAWTESAGMQAYMKKNNLGSPADCQIQFTNEISNYLAGKGKRMMGWNEIMGKNIHGFDNAADYNAENALSKGTVVHFWKGDIGMITDAAQKGYFIVNSLHSETYLNYDYHLSLKRMYNFSPVPEGLKEEFKENIIGVGAQMWTEWTPTFKDIEYHTFPRIAAIAEVAWSGKRDYNDFLMRLKEKGKEWTGKGINFPAEEIK